MDRKTYNGRVPDGDAVHSDWAYAYSLLAAGERDWIA
jgi:hypothetical protein